jgi:myo-inositol-1(or 4)-monophosphatase
VLLPPADQLLEAAVGAARAGAAVLLAAYGDVLAVDIKTHARDLVTQVDTASERAILAELAARWPDIGLLAEESGASRPGAEAVWIVDPLDGTTNFAHGYPVFSVSIGCVDTLGPLVGVVLDPLRDELFTAIRGEGAYLNGSRLSVSAVTALEDALFTTGFPYFPPEERRLAAEVFADVIAIAAAERRTGSAALDLATVAAGRSEAHYELNLAPHDVAAGVLLVTEAGGRVDGLRSPPTGGWVRGIVATNGSALHARLVGLVAPPFGLVAEPLSFARFLQRSEGA